MKSYIEVTCRQDIAGQGLKALKVVGGRENVRMEHNFFNLYFLIDIQDTAARFCHTFG